MGFQGEWKEVILSSISKRITRKNSNLESNMPLTISATDGLIDQSLFFNNRVASSNLLGYYLIKKGEFAYNKSYSNGNPFGSVKRLDKYPCGALSTLYIVFSLSNEVSSDYITHFFETTLWHKDVSMRASEGARNHGLLNISAEDFLDIKVVLPKEVSEQRAIASFFKLLDVQIAAVTKKIEKLKQTKAACLQTMFPQDGETTPKVRFNGFKGEWNGDILANTATFTKGHGYTKNDLCDSGYPIILYGRMYTNYQSEIKEVDTFVESNKNALLSKGNEIIIPASGETAEDIAIAASISTPNIIIGGDLNVIYPNDFFIPNFLALAISHGKAKKMLSMKAQGKTIVHLHCGDISKLFVNFPSIAEQQAIADFFHNLDTMISLHAKRLAYLKRIKAACLEEMFV